MTHNHKIIDTDKSFVINPKSRSITTSNNELILSQGDHNSERYTFEIPRMVEGHDMSLCNHIEIHYDNISRNKKDVSEGFYVVNDLTTFDDAVCFTWLVSRNVTRLAGSVQFWISFSCVDETDEIVYSWGTDIFKGIKVIANNRNTEEVINTFPDILEQWREEVLESVGYDGERHVTLMASPTEEGDVLCLRDFESGIYVLNGQYKLFNGYNETLDFDSDTFANISRTKSMSYVQAIIAENNTIKYLEISDGSVFRKDIALKNVPTEDRVNDMIYEALGVIENGAY